MTLTQIQPDGILEIPGIAQVVVATGGRHVYFSGQLPVDDAGSLVGDDLQTQAAAAFRNLLRCLDAVGASPADVVRHTIYVVDYSIDCVDAIYAAAAEVFGDGAPTSTSTLLGVQSLFLPGQRVEIDAIAVLE